MDKANVLIDFQSQYETTVAIPSGVEPFEAHPSPSYF